MVRAVRRVGLAVTLLTVTFVAGLWVGHAQGSEGRVLELRRYTANPGKLDALVQRMREGETKLFEKHGMKGVFYSVPADAPDSQNTFIYVLAHESRDAAKASWDAFRNDPAWKTLRDASEANGALVGKVDSIFIKPTDFSPTR
jgi:NIPSNAP protein